MAKTGNQLTGNAPTDGRSQTLQVAGSWIEADVTSSPQTSPLSYTTGVYTLIVPNNAVEFVINPTTDLKISATSANLTTYTLVPANSIIAFGCASTQNIYIQRSSASGTAYFRFNLIEPRP